MGKLLSAFSLPLNWQSVSGQLKKLSEPGEIEKIVDQKMDKIIKEEHPQDYEEFIKKNKYEIESIKKRMVEKYSYAS